MTGTETSSLDAETRGDQRRPRELRPLIKGLKRPSANKAMWKVAWLQGSCHWSVRGHVEVLGGRAHGARVNSSLEGEVEAVLGADQQQWKEWRRSKVGPA